MRRASSRVRTSPTSRRSPSQIANSAIDADSGIGNRYVPSRVAGVLLRNTCSTWVVATWELIFVSILIDTKISSQVATTHVEQVFRNNTPATLEGTYLFPIPESASIAEFAIWDGDRRLVGEVRTREEARRIYDEIVRRQRDPGLLEYAGKDLFQASIFPILPHSDKKLEITYTQVVRAG